MANWTAPREKIIKNPWFGAKDWSKDRVKKVLAKRIATHWRTILEDTYPKWFLDLHKRIFAVTYRIPSQDLSRWLIMKHIHHPYLYSDVMNYRAAAHAMLLGGHDDRRTESLFIVVGSNKLVHISDMMQQWTAAYDIDHVLNRSKRRTIMNLPAHISTSMLCYFSGLQLDRPLYTKQEVTWACALAKRFTHMPRVMENKAILHPTSADLNNAIRRYAIMSGEPMSINATKSYDNLAQYIADAGHRDLMMYRSYGTFVDATTVTSLFKTAEEIHKEIHRGMHQQDTERMTRRLGLPAETMTKLPPIPLPQHASITFLDTVGAVIEEGQLMEHCISSYARSAAEGSLFVFHIEHQEEMATGVVSRTAWATHAAQCHGPRNKANKASKFGQRVLNLWALGLATNKLGKSMSQAADALAYGAQAMEAMQIE
jgi:hypothetical protein